MTSTILDLETTIDKDALQYVLSLPQGRKVLWDIFAAAGVFRQPYVAGNPDGTAFNCGGLNIGLALYADCLTVSPDHTAMMVKEQASHDNRESLDARADSGSGDAQSGALRNSGSDRSEQSRAEAERSEPGSAGPARGSLPSAD